MGYRVSWIARAGNSTVELIELSKRELTDERYEFLDTGWYLLELPTAVDRPWVLLIADGSEHFGGLTEEQARSLSKSGQETLYFYCSDTVMATALVCFKNGSELWPIDYDCNVSSKRLELTGSFPQIAKEILDGFRAKQQTADAVDYV